MGLQHYELQILEALARAPSDDWSFTTRTVGSLRSGGSPDVRLPMGIMPRARPAVARSLGRWAYRGARLVHRFDLRLPPASVPEVVTIHDLPPLRFADEGRIARWSMATARDARLVICPSTFAAAEVSELLDIEPGKIVVVPNGVSPMFRTATRFNPRELSRLGITTPFVLHVGGATERKNLGGLAGAWREASGRLPDISLVLTGPRDARRDHAFANSPRVVMIGYRAAEEVARLMASAVLVVVPSRYEGFGLPAVEAMAAGTPVVAARAGALPEVTGEAAVLATPEAASIATAILRVVGDPILREDLIRRGLEHAADFTWSRAARGHLNAYELAFGEQLGS